MSAPVYYMLKHPLVVTLRGPDGEREEVTTELTLRRLRAKDLRGVDKMSEIDQVLVLIGKSTSLAAVQVDEIDLEDIVGLGTVIQDFLPDGLRTGLISSAI